MADAMTKAEIEALVKFKAEQDAAAEQERLASRSLEQVFLDEFTAITEGEKSPMHIMEALATVAAFFHDDDPELTFDATDVPEGKEFLAHPNIAQYNQGGVMGNLCYQADMMRQRETKRFHWLRQNAANKRHAYAGGEIDTHELEFAEKEYGRCKVVTRPIAEDWEKAVKTAYLVQTGQEWTKPVKRDTSATTEDLDSRFAHSKSRSRL